MGVSTKGGGTVSIANGQTTSGVIDTNNYESIAFVLPAAFTGASVSFSVSQDNSTYAALYASGNTLQSVTVTQGRAYAIPADALNFRYVKIVSASSEAGARTIVWSGRIS